jgi:hypothetical protein
MTPTHMKDAVDQALFLKSTYLQKNGERNSGEAKDK